VALEHSILTAVWHILTDDADYHDLGGDYFTRLDPERATRRAIRQLNALGDSVRLDPSKPPDSNHRPQPHQQRRSSRDLRLTGYFRTSFTLVRRSRARSC
jgi:hypothetical protein